MGTQQPSVSYSHSGEESRRAGFLAMPTPELESAAMNRLASLGNRIRFVVRQHHQASKPPWSAELVTGEDVPHAGSGDISRWIRNWMARYADFCIVLPSEPSTGCGCVRTWAAELGVPFVVLVPRNADTSPLTSGSAPPAAVGRTVVFDSDRDLAHQLGSWLWESADLIAAGADRRTQPFATTEPLRRRHVEAWRAMGDLERQAVADELQANRGEIVELLGDPFGFAWAPPATRYGLERLVLRREAPATRPPRALTAGEWDAFHAAVDEYGWGAHEASETLAAGIAHEMNRATREAEGILLRKHALTTVKGWKVLHEER
jgi:hypothetical protein